MEHQVTFYRVITTSDCNIETSFFTYYRKSRTLPLTVIYFCSALYQHVHVWCNISRLGEHALYVTQSSARNDPWWYIWDRNRMRAQVTNGTYIYVRLQLTYVVPYWALIPMCIKQISWNSVTHYPLQEINIRGALLWLGKRAHKHFFTDAISKSNKLHIKWIVNTFWYTENRNRNVQQLWQCNEYIEW